MGDIPRTVVVYIDGDALTLEIEQPDGMDEDEFYEKVCEYVYSHIEIEIR